MPALMSQHHFGWLPDVPDQRDLYLEDTEEGAFDITAVQPSAVDLSFSGATLFDQKNLGSCTFNAISSVYQYALHIQGAPMIVPSRLFGYYNERMIENSIPWDSGAYIRDGFKVLNALGVCLESTWPYVVKKFATKPPVKAYKEAQKHQAIKYMRLGTPDVVTVDQMKACLAAGFPFVFGFTVYESFESDAVDRTGVVPMPSKSEDTLGGHAVAAVGDNDQDQRILCQNSWGPKWGKGGFFTIPYDYIGDPNLADDFWTLRLVE